MIKKTYILFACFLFSIIVNIFTPKYYDYLFVFTCFILFLLPAIYVIFYQYKKNRQVGFETVFIIGFIATNYLYPVFYYPFNPYFSLFNYSFDESVISKSTAIATSGGLSFIVGLMINFKNIVQDKKIIKNDNIDLSRLVLLYFLFFLFLIFVGDEFLSGVYKGTANWQGISNYIYVVFFYYMLYLIYLDIYKNRGVGCFRFYKKVNYYLWLLVLFYVVMFFVLGSRTGPSQLFLFVLYMFSYYVYRIKISKALVLLVVGAIAANIVSGVRTSSIFGYSNYSFFERVTDYKFTENILDIFSDMIINNRNLYTMVSYVEYNGYNYGITFLSSILSIVPFFQKLFLDISGLSMYDISSSYFNTRLEFGDHVEFGFGTNIIGDIYIAFGFIGVCVLMFLLGFMINKINVKALSGDPFSVYVYGVFFSVSLFMNRADYLYFLRPVLWMMFICYLDQVVFTKRISLRKK